MLNDLDVRLFETILLKSCDQAEILLSSPNTDDTNSECNISNLEMSPLIGKQLLAAALRLAKELGLCGGLQPSLLHRFRAPVPGVAVEAQRRAISTDVQNRGLPMELASDYVDTLQRRIGVAEHELPKVLWNYASLYDNLWSDPRIGAGTATRRIMLAMATVLRARSAQLVATKNHRPPLQPTEHHRQL